MYEVSLELLNGFALYSHRRHVWSLAWTSLKVKVSRDTPRVRSRSEDRRAQPGGAVAVLPVRLPRGRPEASPPLTTVRWRPIRSLHDVAATKHRTTVTSHPMWRAARHFAQFPASATTSGELILLPVWGPAPQSKRQTTPARKVQRLRHSAVVLANFTGISHFASPKWRLKLLPVPVLT